MSKSENGSLNNWRSWRPGRPGYVVVGLLPDEHPMRTEWEASVKRTARSFRNDGPEINSSALKRADRALKGDRNKVSEAQVIGVVVSMHAGIPTSGEKGLINQLASFGEVTFNQRELRDLGCEAELSLEDLLKKQERGDRGRAPGQALVVGKVVTFPAKYLENCRDSAFYYNGWMMFPTVGVLSLSMTGQFLKNEDIDELVDTLLLKGSVDDNDGKKDKNKEKDDKAKEKDSKDEKKDEEKNSKDEKKAGTKEEVTTTKTSESDVGGERVVERETTRVTKETTVEGDVPPPPPAHAPRTGRRS